MGACRRPLSGGLHSPKGRALPVAQPLLPLPRGAPARLRSVRRAFKPAPAPGPYRLPHDIRDHLAAALAPYRNRDAAYDLAAFLGRFWSSPNRIARTFVIDRRALAQVAALDLTEARVRGAIRVLEEVGYIDRAVTRGSPYQPTPEGLRRKPVEFQFGIDYVPLLVGANRRAAAARERRQLARPLPMLAGPVRSSTAPPAPLLPGARTLNSPKIKLSEATVVYLGENRASPPSTPCNPKLEAALDHWKKAAEKAGLLKDEPNRDSLRSG